jgi:hypothetical protein
MSIPATKIAVWYQAVRATDRKIALMGDTHRENWPLVAPDGDHCVCESQETAIMLAPTELIHQIVERSPGEGWHHACHGDGRCACLR